MENQGNMTPPKDHGNLPITKPRNFEICYFPDNEFKLAVLRKLSELHENTSNSVISGKQYMNKMRSLTKGNHKKKNQTNFGAEEFNE